MKVLYFTATGNSMHVAKSLGGQAYSIPQLVKEGQYTFTDEKIGIVFPLHAWSTPPLVVDFLKKVTFNCEYLFAIITYGVYTGAVGNQLIEIGKDAGYSYSYINKISMVDNYLPTFDMEKEVAKEPKKQVEAHLREIQADIDSSKKWLMKESRFDKMATNYMLRRGDKPFSKRQLKIHAVGDGIDRYIQVEDTCNQCGVCARVCPVDNIEMDKENGKIRLSDKCFMCFACVHHCPSNAIHVKGQVSRARYRNRNVSLTEIIEANG